jgi:hypothetical protein
MRVQDVVGYALIVACVIAALVTGRNGVFHARRVTDRDTAPLVKASINFAVAGIAAFTAITLYTRRNGPVPSLSRTLSRSRSGTMPPTMDVATMAGTMA